MSTWASKVAVLGANAMATAPDFTGAASTDTLNGAPSVRFTDGQNQLLVTAPFLLAADFALFVVQSTYFEGMALEYNTVTGWFGAGFLWGEGPCVANTGTTRRFCVFAANYRNATGPKLGVLYSNGTHFLQRTNGAEDTLVAANTAVPTSFPPLKPSGAQTLLKDMSIGCRYRASADPQAQYCFQGHMPEILLVNGVLPLASIQAVEAYLLAKYGIV